MGWLVDSKGVIWYESLPGKRFDRIKTTSDSFKVLPISTKQRLQDILLLFRSSSRFNIFRTKTQQYQMRLRCINSRFGQLSHFHHSPLLALWATGNIFSGQAKHHFLDCFGYSFRYLSVWVNKFSQKRDALLFIGVCQEPKISDFHKSVWQDMQKKAPDKFAGIQSHDFDFIIAFSVFIGKGDLVVFYRHNAVV